MADYAKLSQATEKSTDGGDPVGGTAGKIALDQAAFTPAPPEDAAGGAPPAAAPPAEAPTGVSVGGNATAPAEPTAAMGEQPPAETSPAESAAAPAETTAAEGEAAASASPTSFVFLA